MEYYTKTEIENKESQFYTATEVPRFNQYRIINGILYRWFQDYENKEDCPVDIEEILINNSLQPNKENWRDHYEYRYETDILYNSILMIKQIEHRARRKKGLVREWVLTMEVTNYFNTNFKLVNPNEACQIDFESILKVSVGLTYSMKRYLFDCEYRDNFKSFIISNIGSESDFSFKIDSNQFILFGKAIITPINGLEGIFSFINGYDFSYNLKNNENSIFELIKRPEF